MFESIEKTTNDIPKDNENNNSSDTTTTPENTEDLIARHRQKYMERFQNTNIEPKTVDDMLKAKEADIMDY